MEDNNLTNANKNGTSGSKMPVLNYEDVDFLNEELHSNTNLGELTSCGSMDYIFDELLRDTHACTHFHTCNPPGPEFPHSHTCVHMHTKIVGPSSNDDSQDHDDSSESREHNGRKREWGRGGNREAVRKYRQKKKAHTASLANELASLRASNQQLMQRLQNRASLEAEVARLKCLLVDIRGRIEGEIGSFPYQKAVKTADMYHNTPDTSFPSSSNIACNEDGKCGQDCEFQNLHCMGGLGSPSSFS
ncbi:hypothetical protein KSS87_020081 [Heliosperma pusillum]|nr:hypothetical protein KSS87_020081 [Heliosperma pusillum]